MMMRKEPAQTPCIIRRGTITDCAAIADVHAASWKTTYRGQIPDLYLAELTTTSFENSWRELLLPTPERRNHVFVAQDDARIVGFIDLGPSRDEDAIPGTTGEIYSIYLYADAQGGGIGRQLWARAVDELKKEGFSVATLWVLDTNTAARRFYERMGCTLDGHEKPHTIGGAKVLEVRYRVAL